MKTLISALLFFSVTAFADVTNKVTVSWNPNPEPDITAYHIYWGTGTQTNKVSAGLNLTHSITNLAWSSNYWFFVTASNLYLESDPSEAVLYTIPAKPVKPATPSGVALDLRLLSANNILGPFKERVRFKYEVEPQFFVTAITVTNEPPPPIPAP